MTILLDTITFQKHATSGWVYSGLTDWRGQVGNKVAITQRPQAPGGFPSDPIRTSRAISFTASYLADTAADVEAAMDELAAVGADESVLMTVTQSDTTWRWVSVEVAAAADHFDRSTGTATVDLIAIDPRRYATGGWQETAPPTAGDGVVWPLVWPLVWPGGGNPGRVSLTNSGKAPSSPVFQLVGGMGSAVITCVDTGARIGFDRAIASGQTVEIDVASRRATQGGNDVSRWLRYREWQEVPAGTTRRYQLAVTSPSGSPLLRGKVDSAWW
ncbi:phage tail domain-containing protein [Microbacterium schleiferi]|uniref:phage tail domain-containing protein n=1 Tax=Microbacterium schleiferi TaxID=69362 RepID=UPI001D17A189|nr:phage tail domain-containing protein [Microbacterium schleiferi]MCC4266243.1 phage tail family protein [Microbacterium schleiferi]